MPFVVYEERQVEGLPSVLRHVSQAPAPGPLAYVLYAVCLAYVWDGRCRFNRWAELLGALRSVCVLLEEKLATYEHQKEEDNGAVSAVQIMAQMNDEGE